MVVFTICTHISASTFVVIFAIASNPAPIGNTGYKSGGGGNGISNEDDMAILDR